MFSYRDASDTEIAEFRKQSMEETRKKEEAWKKKVEKYPSLKNRAPHLHAVKFTGPDNLLQNINR